MEAFDAYLNKVEGQTKKSFGEFQNIKWLNPYRDEPLLNYRKQLISKNSASSLFKSTKPYYQQLSNGCKLCGLGSWSCLFITNKCNANCFYCPASQQTDEVPATQSLTFETAEAYADYINFFNFKGVSFSGGEPLLFFDRTLHYLKTVRKMCDPEIYIWMYTNGILTDAAKLKKLAAAGLNEIRFDIGATGYKLDKVRLAQKIIPNVTIEIPAVPEEKERIKKLLPEMIEAGVTNLNLHQLRLTKHNAPKLLKRNYTFIPAEQPIVLESETAALETINFARENQLEIGINYCSFAFKNRFQKAGFRKQLAQALVGDDEKITQKGFIRNQTENTVGYKTFLISDSSKPGNAETELKLQHKTCFIKKENVMIPCQFSEEEKAEVESLIKSEPKEIPADDFQFKIWQFEYIENGLREY
jgi:pyruvate formate-lyase activating enzyme-like uncharacterized protein